MNQNTPRKQWKSKLYDLDNYFLWTNDLNWTLVYRLNCYRFIFWKDVLNFYGYV